MLSLVSSIDRITDSCCCCKPCGLLVSDLAVPSFFSSFLEAMLLAIANVLSEFCSSVIYQSNENQGHVLSSDSMQRYRSTTDYLPDIKTSLVASKELHNFTGRTQDATVDMIRDRSEYAGQGGSRH